MKNIPLYLCIISTILSSIIYLGVASFYHFFILLLFFFSLRKGNNTEEILSSTKKHAILRFTFLWMAYALMTTIYSVDPGLSMQYTYYILLIYLQVWLFIFYLNDKESLITTVHFFIIIAAIACAVGLWEYFTGNHLIKDFLDSPIRKRLLVNVPGFTYRNPNDFAMLLLQLLPFSFYGLLFGQKRFYKLMSFANVFLILFVVGTTQSRTIFIAVLIYIAIIILKCFKKSWSKLFASGIVLLIILQFIPQINQLMQNAFESISKAKLTDSLMLSGGSGKTRINLFLNCMLMLLHSGGFGVGAGCHRLYMYHYSLEYFATGHVIVAHNFIAEFLADYGIIMFCTLLYFSSRTLRKIRYISKNADIDPDLKNIAIPLNLSIWMFPLGAVTQSSIIQMTSLWLTIGFIAAYTQICDQIITNNLQNRTNETETITGRI